MSLEVQCIALPIKPDPLETELERTGRICQALDALENTREVRPDLSIVLGPEGFLMVDDHPISAASYQTLFENALDMFGNPAYADCLIVPGSLYYEDGDCIFHVSPCFLGGTKIACEILQQTFSQDRGIAQSRNAVFCRPHDWRVLGGSPAERVDHFRPETGVRIGIEIGEDHFAGHLWSAFSAFTDDLPDLQLVPSSGRKLTDGKNRIYGNTAAVRPGGLLFGCHGPHNDSQDSGAAQLFRALGDGMFQPLRPTTVLTGAGLVYRYPSTVL